MFVSPCPQALYWADVGFTIIFALEAVMKIIAWTFTRYLKQGQNVVDFVIVVTSILGEFLVL